MRAVGAKREDIARLFLVEAVILTLLGGIGGVAAGLSIAGVLRLTVPGMPVFTPVGYIAAALLVSALTGFIAGVIPARRAARLHPIEALRAE